MSAAPVEKHSFKGTNMPEVGPLPLVLDAIRSTAAGAGAECGKILSVFALWSKTPADKLSGLPTLAEASADFICREFEKVCQALYPVLGRRLPRVISSFSVNEVERLRRCVLHCNEENVSISSFAEVIAEMSLPHAWISKEGTQLLIEALDIHREEKVYCSFSLAARPAWEISKTHEVFLEVEDEGSEIILSLLSTACGQRLNIQIKNIVSAAENAAVEKYDRALVFPPLGTKLNRDLYSQHPDVSSADALGMVWGSKLGRKRSIVVVGNGFLCRSASTDVALRQSVIERLHAVVALPRRIFPQANINTSAMVFAPEAERANRSSFVCFIDQANYPRMELHIFQKILMCEAGHDKCALINKREIADAVFNFSVDKYVLDEKTKENQKILNNLKLVTLSDVAEIRRPQALPRHGGGGQSFKVREALLADIEGTRLTLPTKVSELPDKARFIVEEAELRPDDILLSIKGTIGKVAIVSEAVLKESLEVPIVAGQSFVILRLRSGGPYSDPRALVAFLRSPLAKSLLEGSASGTVIPNISMGGLRALPVPIISRGNQALIVKKHHENEAIRDEIETLLKKSALVEAQMSDVALGIVT